MNKLYMGNKELCIISTYPNRLRAKVWEQTKRREIWGMNRKTEELFERAVKTMRDGELARAYVDTVCRINQVFEKGIYETHNTYSELELILLEEMAKRYVKERVLHD